MRGDQSPSPGFPFYGSSQVWFTTRRLMVAFFSNPTAVCFKVLCRLSAQCHCSRDR
jgi:hypothetical protein